MIDQEKIIELVEDLGHTIHIQNEIKSGKEATVFKVLLDEKLAAMKVYTIPENNTFKNNQKYLENQFFKTKSHERAVQKKSKFGKSLQFTNWVESEFRLLEKLHDAGASIPNPILQVEHIIFMELIGNETEVAPRLHDVELKNYSKEIIQDIFDLIFVAQDIFLNNGLVHGDLSSYNILLWKDTPYIIDFPQALNMHTNPNAKTMLIRDIETVCNYFSKYISISSDKILLHYLTKYDNMFFRYE
jgi:RIO kinase 1